MPTTLLGYYGGKVFGRAYDPETLAGDSTILGTFKLSQKIEGTPLWLPDLQLIGYIA